MEPPASKKSFMKPAIIGIAFILLIAVAVAIWYFTKRASPDDTVPESPAPVPTGTPPAPVPSVTPTPVPSVTPTPDSSGTPTPDPSVTPTPVPSGTPASVPSAPIIPTGTPVGAQTSGYTVYTNQRCYMTNRMITSVTVPANSSTADVQNLCNQTSGCLGATTDGHGNWVLLTSVSMTRSNVDTCMVKN